MPGIWVPFFFLFETSSGPSYVVLIFFQHYKVNHRTFMSDILA
jgi:hypothetical protein